MMRLLKSCSIAAAAVLGSTAAMAVEVTFLSDDDGSYQAQNSSQPTLYCFAPATCDVQPGRHRLINFDDEHSVYITVNDDGTVRYTYGGGAPFPFAVPATGNPDPGPDPDPNPVPDPPPSNAQYRLETVIVNRDCRLSEPGRPAEVSGNQPNCTAFCPDSYQLTGGNCRGVSPQVRQFDPTTGTSFLTDIRQPLIETPLANGYQCRYDNDYQYGGAVFDYNNSDGTNVTATAICATIVSQ